MHGKSESETNDASTSKPIIVTELTALKRLEQDERHLHDKKELSSNVFYRLLIVMCKQSGIYGTASWNTPDGKDERQLQQFGRELVHQRK
ncbi:hypothetical protein NDU88_007042 [Pleurodeles waltl]|uniref:Uncharacterized protein n=1 Tax=Pleurodeles waltl TaxID=8319 RepID=A0AAV7MF75_PLEWA|nr:hypothetical protein NDU88_007042 [Pleurodeles waltl]